MRIIVRAGAARRTLRLAQHLFTVIGILALGYCLWMYGDAKSYQAREARRFALELQRKSPAQSPAPASTIPAPVPKSGSVVARLLIPRIGVSVMVVEGADAPELKRAAGHIPGTALPGEPGNVGIAAHRDTFFRPLRSIERNDAITVSTLAGAYRYRVVSTGIVSPRDVQVLSPTGRDTLTLVTCYPFYYVGSAPKRFIVRAERVPG